jgi:hypothetical protein
MLKSATINADLTNTLQGVRDVLGQLPNLDNFISVWNRGQNSSKGISVDDCNSTLPVVALPRMSWTCYSRF